MDVLGSNYKCSLWGSYARLPSNLRLSGCIAKVCPVKKCPSIVGNVPRHLRDVHVMTRGQSLYYSKRAKKVSDLNWSTHKCCHRRQRLESTSFFRRIARQVVRDRRLIGRERQNRSRSQARRVRASPVESQAAGVRASPVESQATGVRASPVESQATRVRASPVESQATRVRASPIQSQVKRVRAFSPTDSEPSASSPNRHSRVDLPQVSSPLRTSTPLSKAKEVKSKLRFQFKMPEKYVKHLMSPCGGGYREDRAREYALNIQKYLVYLGTIVALEHSVKEAQSPNI